jgi:hypothetical protein
MWSAQNMRLIFLCTGILLTFCAICTIALFSAYYKSHQQASQLKSLPVILPVWKQNEPQQQTWPIPLATHGTQHCTLKNATQKASTQVAVFIPSPIPWANRRRKVTETFLQQQWSPCLVHYVYILGTRAGAMMEETLPLDTVQEEIDMYKHVDNLHYFLSGCRDEGDEKNNPNGTSATTCKTYEGFRFAARHFEAQYVWRGADDAYLNLKFFFATVVPSLPTGPLYMGHMRSPADEWDANDMKLNGQAALQKHVWRIGMFGAYMLGMGFMVTMDVAEFVNSWKIPPHMSWCEDVIVGAWMMPFQIHWIEANNYGWSMYNRQDYLDSSGRNDGRCQHQLLVHYVYETDWDGINQSTGNMLFCREK